MIRGQRTKVIHEFVFEFEELQNMGLESEQQDHMHETASKLLESEGRDVKSGSYRFDMGTGYGEESVIFFEI